MKKTSVGIALCALLFALSFPVWAQQAGKVPRIGFLFPGSASTRSVFIEAFRQGLRDLGYIEGKNITVEYRYAEGKMERLPDLAAELVRLKVDVIVAGGGQAIRAAKKATTTIPIVFPSVGDPVASGLVASLARPGGNITGLTLLEPELSGKRLELLNEALPRISRVAVLQGPGQGDLKETQTAGQLLGLKLQFLEIGDAAGVETVFSAMSRERADAFMTLVHPVIGVQRKRILEFAAKNRLPSIHGDKEWADGGGLISYGPDRPDLFRRSAIYVDKILKGTKPADLPVEQPTKFEFIINLKTASRSV